MRYDAIGAPEALAILDDGEDDGNKPMEDDGGTKDTSPDVIVLDDPFEFKGIRKVLPPLIIRYTYVDDVAVETPAASAKHYLQD